MVDSKPFELTTLKECHSSGDYKWPYVGDNSSDKFRINWQITLNYSLDINAIKTLSAQGATNVRVYHKPEKYQDYKIGKKKYATLQNLIACIK